MYRGSLPKHGKMLFFRKILAGFKLNHITIPARAGYFLSVYGPPLILLFILLISLGRDLFSGNVIGSTHLDNDLSYFIALRQYAFSSNSSFPLWNPYLMCGVPLVAEIQSGLFYPPNIVFRIFPLSIAINVSLLLHLYLLVLGTYYFGRQIQISRTGAMIGASIFGFCGPVFLRLFIGHHSDLYTIAWIPAVFLIVHKIGLNGGLRYFIYLGWVFCLQFLAGHPQYLFYTLFISWLYLLFLTRHLLRRKLFQTWLFHNAGFFLGIGIAVLIGLPQILPVREMLMLSSRQSMEMSEVARFSFPLPNLLTFLTPLLFGDGVRIPYWGLYNLWEMCAYCGTMSLLLSVFALREGKNSSHVLFLAFMAVFTIILALGDATPLFDLFYLFVPGFKMFRGHSKVYLFCCFAIALLAGIGFDTLQQAVRRNVRRFILPLLVGLILFVGLLLLPVAGLLEDPVKALLTDFQNDPRSYLPVPGAGSAEFASAAIKQAVMSMRYFLICLFLGIFLVLLTLRFGNQRWLKGVTIIFILADLFIFSQSFVSSVDVRHWNLKPEVLDFIYRDKTLHRSAMITSFGPKYGTTSLLQQIGGDYPYVLKRYSRLYNLANQGQPTPSMKIGNLRRVSPAFNQFNLKYLVLDSKQKLDILGFYEVYDDGELSILKNEYARRRVYLPPQAKIVVDEDEALRGVFELPSIRGDQIILEKDSISNISFDYGSLLHPKDPNEIVEVVNYSANQIVIRTQLAADAWLVLADTFYPGWTATIDGRAEIPIVPANYVFRAVYAPAGTHHIVFKYRPTYFLLSLSVALMTLLVTGLVAVYRPKPGQ